MTLLPLDQLRLNARSHTSALRWVGLLYCQPNEVKTADKLLRRWSRVVAFLKIYLHFLPYLVLACALGRWAFFGLLDLPPDPGSGQKLILILCGSLIAGLLFSFKTVAGGLFISSFTFLILSFGFGFPFSVFAIFSAFMAGLTMSVGAEAKAEVDAAYTFKFSLGLSVLFGVAAGYTGGLAVGILAGLTFSIGFLRLYYLPVHFFWLMSGLRSDLFRFHPVAWDNACFIPFSGLDYLLVRLATDHPDVGRREIDRLIDEHPFRIQRPAALRARAILVARRAAATTDLARLDEILASLPVGRKGFLEETPELSRRVHEITALQARLDTLDRPFLREPFAALLVKEIEIFEQRIAGFRQPLSTEFRKAARQWLVIARQQLDAVRSAATREPTSQVFRAGDPVDREREAFVLRAAILGELERQVMLATGCPGLLVYGRRRMGKSTLLRNLEGLLPPRVLLVSLSMQEARAFTSLPDLLALIAQRVAAVLPEPGELPADLKSFEQFLGATQKRLDADDRRLLLAIDEYENLDSKIGEGALSEDLLAVIRESIQTHRRLIWAFAGSHGIDELVHARWSSYLVSARTIEVTPFEPAETRLLLTEPLKHSSLWRVSGSEPPRFEPGFWGEGGIERIHAEAGGWPHLVQLIAETVVDLVNDAGGASVDDALLERALDRAVVRGNNVFLELLERESRLPGEWDYLRGFRRVEEQPVPDDEVLERSLRRRRLVIEEGGRYRLRVPLMGRWLRQRV